VKDLPTFSGLLLILLLGTSAKAKVTHSGEITTCPMAGRGGARGEGAQKGRALL